jgi:hypothetical protein
MARVITHREFKLLLGAGNFPTKRSLRNKLAVGTTKTALI